MAFILPQVKIRQQERECIPECTDNREGHVLVARKSYLSGRGNVLVACDSYLSGRGNVLVARKSYMRVAGTLPLPVFDYSRLPFNQAGEACGAVGRERDRSFLWRFAS